MCPINYAKEKCSPMVELHYASLNRAGGGRCQDSSAAFPHDLHHTAEDYIVDDTDCEVNES